ncbi:NAD-dependent epimerase/dehydratase family protein [Tateyamaria omphalii]|uniref:NAD-dependent epimerase/dehydratase family protein n=1 Tax=Tateyamaria omphalii TaxID=299262 RepID=UPI001679C0BF|nr:NAD(P)-dependent oxidoreductase [Tateyamaria omphalii]
MGRYVVTGSSGRIGSAIVRHLSKNNEVVGVDRAPSNFTHVIADICDHTALQRACAGADAVFHAAALHAPHVPTTPEAEFARINIEGTANVLHAVRTNGVKSLIFTSTTALYGYASQQEGQTSWINENTTPQPRTIYHRTKLEGEDMLQSAASDDLAVRVIRMSRCFPEPAPMMAVYRLHRGIDARDVAHAHTLALSHSGSPFEVFIASGQTPFQKSDQEELWHDAPHVIRRRAPDLAKAFDNRGWSLPPRIDRVYDPKRAITRLGWKPMFGVASVLSQYDGNSPEVLPLDAIGSTISE